MVFSHTVEGLFSRALEGNVPPALVDQCKKIGLDLTNKLLPAYPVSTWNQVVEATVGVLYPGQPVPEAACQLGERMMDGYRATLVGQAAIAMSKVVGPRRALLRSRQTWRSGNNYSEVKVEELSASDFRLTFNETGISRWVSQGLLRAGLVFTGAKELVVDIERFAESEVVYRITWKG